MVRWWVPAENSWIQRSWILIIIIFFFFFFLEGHTATQCHRLCQWKMFAKVWPFLIPVVHSEPLIKQRIFLRLKFKKNNNNNNTCYHFKSTSGLRHSLLIYIYICVYIRYLYQCRWKKWKVKLCLVQHLIKKNIYGGFCLFPKVALISAPIGCTT